mgnify:CR=1 FL=1
MKKYVCTVCGYIAEGSIPEQCPVCKAPASAFVEKTGITYVTEHVVGIGKAEGVPQEIVDGLRANFEGECSEVGMYLAMARVAHREGYPEIGMYWEKAGLEEKKFFPKEFKVASDAIALIVNRQNPDSIISLKDLSRILTGEVTEWSELYPGSKLGKLQLVFDNPNSSTVRYAIDSICRGRPLAGSLHAQKSNAEVIDFVSQSPSAIGVIGVSWVGSESDSTNLSFSDRVTVMAVSREEKATEQNSYKPFQAYMALGDYPLMRDVYVILTDPRSGLASGFSTFLASDRGQRIILRAGLMPATQNVRIVNVRDNL